MIISAPFSNRAVCNKEERRGEKRRGEVRRGEKRRGEAVSFFNFDGQGSVLLNIFHLLLNVDDIMADSRCVNV